jgi:hypothetical protein
MRGQGLDFNYSSTHQIDSVLWPTIAIAVERGTPERSSVRTAERRKS